MALDVRKLDSRTAEETLRLELDARQHEAGQFARAHRAVLRELEAVLLRQAYEVPVEALSLTARLRDIGDRYARRWEAVA